MGLSVEPRTCACGWQGECDDGEAEDDQKCTLRELWDVSPSCLADCVRTREVVG
jgi:hypothetical protein